jgi:hypothetical protein
MIYIGKGGRYEVNLHIVEVAHCCCKIVAVKGLNRQTGTTPTLINRVSVNRLDYSPYILRS